MKALTDHLHRLADDESGATAIEYGLIAALLAVSCISAMTLFGGGLSGMFNMIADKGSSAMSATGE